MASLEYRIVVNLSRVCEYVYRKGVADAASFGDIPEVQALARRDDNFTTFRFLIDEDSQKLNFEHYRDYIVIFCGMTRSHHLRNFLIFQIGEDSMKRSICTIIDYIYRLGLLEGVKYTKDDAIDYFKAVGTGSYHDRLDGTKPTTMDWIEEIKHYTNKIHNARKRAGLKTTIDRLSVAIGQAVLDEKGKTD